MTDLDWLPPADKTLAVADKPAAAGFAATSRKHRHVWVKYPMLNDDAQAMMERWDPELGVVVDTGDELSTERPAYYYETRCRLCNVIRDETRARRGKQSRNYGNRAELSVARKYGGEKIGHVGGPVDVRGTDWNTQVKTHRRKPPREWTSAFNAMAANRERMPRLLLRFVLGPGVPPEDYFVVRGSDWLAWHGKDGE